MLTSERAGERRAAIYVRVRERAEGGGLGFIGVYDSPRIATIIHLELLFLALGPAR